MVLFYFFPCGEVIVVAFAARVDEVKTSAFERIVVVSRRVVAAVASCQRRMTMNRSILKTF